MRLAAAPISWGVCEVPGWGFQLDRDRVLEDAMRLGMREIEAGPPGFLPPDAGSAREVVERRGMRVIGGYVTAVLHRSERLETELAGLESNARHLAALGSEMLVLAAATGRDDYDVPAELSEDEWPTLVAALPRAAKIARAHGLDIALHPHIGTAIETPGAIDRVLRDTNIPLCLDTGHVFVGGGDPVAIARDHPQRVAHVHLKDADGALAAAVRERRTPYAAAVARGLFRPLGDGGARIADVLAALKRASYAGWYVLEQDIALHEPPTEATDPARDVLRSRDFALAHE
ncbi:MAG TPA: TIM barrel protein [Candidatus Limnocylindrales bacterium]|nr:TIM barrel protein [Candidatus Limnocylindrales bacterium]